MKTKLLSLLKCPKTNESLELVIKSENQDEVVDGVLKSSLVEYPIINGVIDFIDPNNKYIQQEMMHNISDMDSIKQRLSKDELEIYLKEQSLGLNPADYYDTYTRNTMDEILGNLKVSNAKILEIGGSTGRDLVKYFGKEGNTCVEMDINPFLGIASDIIMKHYGFHYERVRADMNELPFQDNQFDIVFGSATFHHIDDPSICFRSIYKILKPGGVFYCLNERVLTSLRPELKDVIAKELEFAHEHAFFSSEWTSFLVDAGFTVKIVRPKYFSYNQIIQRVYGKSKPKKLTGKLKYNYYRMMHLLNLSQSNPLLRFIQGIEDKYLANVPYNAICYKNK